jgi:anti-sigma factor RsiW
MTCVDVQQLLGPFVDAELPSPMLLAVARHAGTCPSCDAAVRELTDLREAVAGAIESAVDGLDLSGVWRHVDATVARSERRGRRVVYLRHAAGWGALAALAATWIFLAPTSMRQPAPTVVAQATKKPAAVRVANRPTEIDRLAGRVVSFQREPKTGAPIIWVNYNTDDPR